jgi:hypothetical protein
MHSKKLTTIPLYGKSLVADDFKGAAINVFFRNLTDTEYADLAVDTKIQAVLDAVPERSSRPLTAQWRSRSFACLGSAARLSDGAQWARASRQRARVVLTVAEIVPASFLAKRLEGILQRIHAGEP